MKKNGGRQPSRALRYAERLRARPLTPSRGALPYGRERGYTDAEAVHVLKASRSYQPKVDEFGRVRESEKAANLKRWLPILCAFTGARVAEMVILPEFNGLDK